jgi:phosphoglycerate kinase
VTALLGGAKVSDKIAVIKNLMFSVNNILIGGAMAYTFLRARGYKTGASKIENGTLKLVNEIYSLAEERNVKIYLPSDHICAKKISCDADFLTVNEEDIPEGYMGLDIGSKTIALYKDILLSSKLIIWNGPLGVFEFDNFSNGTQAMCQALAESQAETIVGGGDSIAALNKFGYYEQMTHVSTGGGASLEFLEGKKLPGLINLSL